MAKQALAAKVQTRNDREDQNSDGPLIDTINIAVKNLIKKGKDRGFLTFGEVNAAFSQTQLNSEQIEDILSSLSDMGVTVTENEESEDSNTSSKEDQEGSALGNVAEDDVGRTDDPVRMYLREMGGVELLSREGEIAIAKRIEAGRELMIGGIAESPLTIKALVKWRDAIKEGQVLLRDVIDLDATYGGNPDIQSVSGAQTLASSDEALKMQKSENVNDNDDSEIDEDDEDIEENNMSLAAMEAALMPEVMETFDKIATIYGKLKKVQDRRLSRMLKGEPATAQSEQRYAKLKDELVELMDGVRLNASRLEALVEQLYKLNKHLVGLDMRLMKAAESNKVKRADFMAQHFGKELEPNWIEMISGLPGNNWKKFAETRADEILTTRESLVVYCGRFRIADTRVS